MTFSPAELARYDLISFVRYVRPDLDIPRHWILIAEALMRVAKGEITRLIIEIPIRHGKTELCHRLFPAWYFGRFPTRQVLSATHKDDLARDCGRDIKRYVDSPEFRDVFPGITLAPDSKAAGKFHVRSGQKREGVLTTVGRRGDAAGRGANILIPDDLVGETEAYSAAAIEESKIMLRSLRGRLEPGGAIILIQSRISEDDPAAYVRAQYPLDGWEVLRFPALAEEHEEHLMPDGSLWVREPGDPLWSERWPRDVLELTREQTPVWEWSAKYQQRPIPVGQRVVEESWFAGSRYDDDPDDLVRSAQRVVLSADTSEGTATGAETALEVFAENARGSYLVEVASERWQVPAIMDKIRDICRARRPTVALIERKSTGVGIIQQLNADPSFRTPIESIMPPPGLPKEARFRVETPYMRAGKLWLPRRNHPRCAHWQQKFEAQLFAYPACALKDQMDGLSQYLGWLRRNPTVSLGASRVMFQAREEMGFL